MIEKIVNVKKKESVKSAISKSGVVTHGNGSETIAVMKGGDVNCYTNIFVLNK